MWSMSNGPSQMSFLDAMKLWTPSLSRSTWTRMCMYDLTSPYVRYSCILHSGDPLLACVCESAKLMFQLWMHSEEWAASDAALFGFTDTLSHSSRLYGRDPYTPFFQQIKDDRTTTMITKHACEAMHSDLCRHHHPFMFDRLITCLVLFRQQNWIPERSRTERSILWSSMVAFRVRVCTEGIFEDDQWPDDNPVVVEMGYFVRCVT